MTVRICYRCLHVGWPVYQKPTKKGQSPRMVCADCGCGWFLIGQYIWAVTAKQNKGGAK